MFGLDLHLATPASGCHAAPMLTELYIEALLADEALADEVWELWNAGVITDDIAAWAWAILASNSRRAG
jgi:hypothetical protein